VLFIWELSGPLVSGAVIALRDVDARWWGACVQQPAGRRVDFRNALGIQSASVSPRAVVANKEKSSGTASAQLHLSNNGISNQGRLFFGTVRA